MTAGYSRSLVFSFGLGLSYILFLMPRIFGFLKIVTIGSNEPTVMDQNSF